MSREMQLAGIIYKRVFYKMFWGNAEMLFLYKIDRMGLRSWLFHVKMHRMTQLVSSKKCKSVKISQSWKSYSSNFHANLASVTDFKPCLDISNVKTRNLIASGYTHWIIDYTRRYLVFSYRESIINL